MKYLEKLAGISVLSLVFAGFGINTAEMAKVPANAPEIQYFGRWNVQDEVYQTGQGATYIKANFSGTSLKADLTGEKIWWRVSIDGGEFRPFKAVGDDTVLAENLSEGEHSVLLVRSTEGEAGIGEFRGFTLEDGESLCQPSPMKTRRLEFVGDSITAGAMNLGAYDGSNYYDVQDGYMAYGPQLARKLDADFSVVARSGEGVMHNYGEKWPLTGIHMGDRYGWAFCYKVRVDDPVLWDTANYPVDAVIVSIGTNDFSGKQKPKLVDFKASYKKLLDIIRSQNPNKPIICIEPVPASVGAKVRKSIEQAVNEMRKDGYEKIYFIPLNEPSPLLKEEDFRNDNTHPTVEGAAKLANYLEPIVARLLGWE
ncbi:MAG: hypothetical protein IKR28_07885 [Selenomonadaceae bacterium]|nr:hypothetical protein [Selenomonadaceae bacterium]